MRTILIVVAFFGMLCTADAQEMGLAKQKVNTRNVEKIEKTDMDGVIRASEASRTHEPRHQDVVKEFTRLYKTDADPKKYLSYLESDDELMQFIQSNPSVLYRLGLSEKELKKIQKMIR